MRAIVKLGMNKEEIKAFKKAYDILIKILDKDDKLIQVAVETMWAEEGILLDFETFVEAMDILTSVAVNPYGDEYSEEDLKE